MLRKQPQIYPYKTIRVYHHSNRSDQMTTKRSFRPLQVCKGIVLYEANLYEADLVLDPYKVVRV